jgi:hypothetical protein
MSASRSVNAIGEPDPAAKSVPLRGQKAIIVKIHTARIDPADSASHTRSRFGVCHPAISAPNAANKIVAEIGAKNCPGLTGKRGPYHETQ